jgi:hypothetical protein
MQQFGVIVYLLPWSLDFDSSSKQQTTPPQYRVAETRDRHDFSISKCERQNKFPRAANITIILVYVCLGFLM